MPSNCVGTQGETRGKTVAERGTGSVSTEAGCVSADCGPCRLDVTTPRVARPRRPPSPRHGCDAIRETIFPGAGRMTSNQGMQCAVVYR